MSDEGQVRDVPPERSRGGEWVRIGDERYRIPPLALRAIQELKGDVEALQGIRGMPTGEQMNAALRIIHSAITRNYPSLAFETLAEMLDLGNVTDVLAAVMSISGYVVERGKGAAPPGEAMASTGTTSTSP